jgi:tRNA dimethylallyltransferase
MRTLHVLTGCTAAGKTEWALRWAQEHGAEIISCDSLLFYRGMEIGTAKPTAAERASVPHHLIDICPVSEPMNVAQYVALARQAAEEIAARGKEVLVVGGSGFYLKAFFGPVADNVAVPQEVRERVAARLAAEGLAGLVAELRRLNPDGLGSLDTDNPRRVARGLERCLASGRTLRDLAVDFARHPDPFEGWRREPRLLERPPEEIDRRIMARVAAMLRAGLVEEVRALRTEGLEKNPSAASAIGYREVIAMLDGRLMPADLEAKIVRDTRALVRKQRTWFRTQLPPHEVTRVSEQPRPGPRFSPD